MKIKKLSKLLLETIDFTKIESYPFNVVSLTTEFETELDKVLVEFTRISDFERSIKYPPALINTKEIIGYNVQYSVSGEDTQHRKSDYKYLIKILKTVTDIIIETITKNDGHTSLYQNIYCVGSISKLGKLTGDDQKNMIYRQIAKNHLPPGYRVSEIEFKDINIDGIAITKNK